MGVQCIDLFIKSVVNVYRNVRFKRIGFFKPIFHVEENGILLQCRHIGHHIRYDNEKSGIHDKSSGVPVIRMIVIRTESNNDICLPVSDFTNNLMSDLESWQKFGVVIVKNFILIYSQSFSRFLSFQSPSSGKGRTPISLVTRIPIGKGYKFRSE